MFGSSELHFSDRQQDEGAAYEAGCKCAQETVDKLNNSLQQLKAEIAAIADTVHSANYGSEIITLKEIESKLRQLSAV